MVEIMPLFMGAKCGINDTIHLTTEGIAPAQFRGMPVPWKAMALKFSSVSQKA